MEAYLIKSSIALAFLYLVYRAVIYSGANHQIKRITGLGILLFSSLFLFIPITQISPSSDLPDAMGGLIEAKSTLESAIPIKLPKEKVSLFMWVYLVGIALLGARFLLGVWGILKLFTKSRKSKKWGFHLVETSKNISPFSFFHFLFIHQGDENKKGLEPIVLHEKVHKDQFHSVDVILLEILSVIFWFNPFIWLLRRDIKASHEFIADQHVIDSGIDKLTYQDLLFEARTGISFQAASYLSSNQTSLKQRFNIMEKSKFNSKNSFVRAGIVLVAMAMTIFLSAFTVLPDRVLSKDPIFQVYTSSGVVDLEKGISRDTEQLFVRVLPPPGGNLSYRVSDVEITLVYEGLGRGSLQFKEMINLKDLLAKLASDEKGVLVLEIKEYQSKTEQNVIKNHSPNSGRFIKIPIN